MFVALLIANGYFPSFAKELFSSVWVWVALHLAFLPVAEFLPLLVLILSLGPGLRVIPV